MPFFFARNPIGVTYNELPAMLTDAIRTFCHIASFDMWRAHQLSIGAPVAVILRQRIYDDPSWSGLPGRKFVGSLLAQVRGAMGRGRAYRLVEGLRSLAIWSRSIRWRGFPYRAYRLARVAPKWLRWMVGKPGRRPAGRNTGREGGRWYVSLTCGGLLRSMLPISRIALPQCRSSTSKISRHKAASLT